MLYHRPAKQRGQAHLDWLDSRFSFSFAEYFDPAHMGFSVLRVINDDRIAPSGGFPTHPHRNMEIISVMLEGQLAHQDSTGERGVIEPGEVQHMTAGQGIRHSEFNPSDSQAARLLQIWITPHSQGLTPRYQQARVAQQGPVTLVAAEHNAPLEIAQDVRLYRVQLAAGEQLSLTTAERWGYLHAYAGSAQGNYASFNDGDALGLGQQHTLQLTAGEFGFSALWFDLPPGHA
ncbi:pirin family protein [Atopomonas sediminilitoris]|uniref:pirin family protein n=1 Tax=Atopomonas sediminilitoris TaxID=2919919 RepID=UPI001F4D831D|nr:pirin-like bicupin family protein [Atopomonas sediminilitoris]MCJ8167874.1 pirin family protein [Atopomonas sediminilitoris]